MSPKEGKLDFENSVKLCIFRFVAELEKSIVSVERVREYQSTPQEADFHLENDPENWPQKGQITFDDYATRYRDGMDLVLRGSIHKPRGYLGGSKTSKKQKS